MPICEKELNVHLFERLHLLKRIKKVAIKENATIQEILDVIEDEENDIKEMLYQKPPLIE